MKRYLISCIWLIAMSVAAQNEGKQQLHKLFEEAELCYLKDDYQQLMSCMKQYANSFMIHRDALGDSVDVFTAYYYKMCGAYYYGLAEVDSFAIYSELCYRKSLDVFNRKVVTNSISGMHVNAVTLHQELAQLYYKTRAYHKAKKQLDTVYTYYDEKMIDGIDSAIPHYYKAISQLAMCNARVGNFAKALSQIDESIDYYRRHRNADYYEALRKRGKILMLQADSLGSTNYKKAIDCYQQYVNERYSAINKELNTMNESQRAQYWLSTHQFLYDCFRLGNRASAMLYNLALYSKGFLLAYEHDKKTMQTNWKQVRQRLGRKECAIEFVQYFARKDERRLGCLVLHGNSKQPEFVDLFSTDSLLQLPLVQGVNIGSAITSSLSSIKDTLYNDKRLQSLIWSPGLMAAIGDADKVYFSPDGIIHQLAIEYIMPDSCKTCCRLSSTRVLTQKRPPMKMKKALLCGGIEYGALFQPNERDNDVMAYRYLSSSAISIKDLPGTRIEVDSIYAYRHSLQDTMLVGKDATDEAVLRLLKRDYDVIHLSTHGYFGGRIGIYTDIKPLLGDDSMSKSGLLFAGSSKTLNDKNFDETLFDGILSATELARQDFSKVELVVLSACQTGLGHLTDDGIYGIQRGLKQAGANSMIVSLWNVNDNSGSLLMRFFYQELARQTVKDVYSAFMTARRKLQEEKSAIYWLDPFSLTIKRYTQSFDAPRHVNPFIVIDAY